MWQEMKKHEKKLRGMIVDYKKRSERRKEYYERIVRSFIKYYFSHLLNSLLL
jgi:arginine/serine-rich splicing factor 16